MIRIEIKNIKQLTSALKSHPDLFIKEFQKALAKAGLVVEIESKKVTPVDTGRLRASISTELKSLMAIISPHTNYALYVHEGTRYMKSRPFMKWGAESAEGRIQQIFLEAEENVLKRIAEKSQ